MRFIVIKQSYDAARPFAVQDTQRRAFGIIGRYETERSQISGGNL